MTHPMQAAADAVIALRLSDKPHGPDEYARAAITAFLDAVAASYLEAAAFGAETEMFLAQHKRVIGLKRIAEESP